MITLAKKAEDLQAERALLGVALLEPAKVLPMLRGKLNTEDFYLRQHCEIWRAIADADTGGVPLDPTIFIEEVRNLLEQCGKLDNVGGSVYLSELVSHACLVASVPYYLERVQEASRKRAISSALLSAAEKAQDNPDAALKEVLALARADTVASADGTAHGIEFPNSALVGIAGEFASLYANYVESPPQFLFTAFLVYLGALIADKITIASELRPQPRLFAVLLGESARARKSAALDFVDRFHREIFHDLNVHYGLGSAEGLACELEGEDGQARSLILHCDELKLLVDKAGQEGSVALPMLTTLFDRNVFDNTTKGKKIRVRNGYLSLVAACTVETYQKMWHPSFRDIGFINRLFLVHGDAKRRFFSPRQVPENEKKRLQEDLLGIVGAINATVEARKRPIEMALDPEAELILQNWYVNLSGSVHERRLETYGLRLCILLEVAQGETRRITPETAKIVRDLLEYELAVRRLYDPIDADTLIARIEESIRRVLGTYGPQTERDLKRRVHYNRCGVWVFNQALTNLLKAGEVVLLPDRKRLSLVDCHQGCHHISRERENAE